METWERPRRIVIVGASLAGLRAAQELRDQGFDGELTIIGAEPHWPYDRPPLSKQLLLGTSEPDDIALEAPEDIEDLGAWVLGRRAVRLDAGARTVLLDDGQAVEFDGLLIATGASPRTLPGTAGMAGVVTLRTIDDSLAIRDAFERGARVAVIGAGFIGCEVASAARTRGLDVTLIEALSALLERAIGREVGEVVAAMHRGHGVDVRCGVSVEKLLGGDRVEAIELAGGERIPADLVVVGIGVRPETAWLEGSGLEGEDGVRCDQYCETSVPGVFAAGDVARWHNPAFDEEMRIEHWTNAVEMGMAAARNMLLPPGEREPFASVPYVWSDQYGLSIRYAGHAAATDTLHLFEGTFESRNFIAGYEREGRLRAVLGFDAGRAFTRYQRLLDSRPTLADALELAAKSR